MKLAQDIGHWQRVHGLAAGGADLATLVVAVL